MKRGQEVHAPYLHPEIDMKEGHKTMKVSSSSPVARQSNSKPRFTELNVLFSRRRLTMACSPGSGYALLNHFNCSQSAAVRLPSAHDILLMTCQKNGRLKSVARNRRQEWGYYLSPDSHHPLVNFSLFRSSTHPTKNLVQHQRKELL